MTVNELVRLVRLFSTPWEEKSAALKKLHEDYESKQRQLNIAIKRLQLVDAHVHISFLFSILMMCYGIICLFKLRNILMLYHVYDLSCMLHFISHNLTTYIFEKIEVKTKQILRSQIQTL